jgi:hypothetical protein
LASQLVDSAVHGAVRRGRHTHRHAPRWPEHPPELGEATGRIEEHETEEANDGVEAGVTARQSLTIHRHERHWEPTHVTLRSLQHGEGDVRPQDKAPRTGERGHLHGRRTGAGGYIKDTLASRDLGGGEKRGHVQDR